MMVALLHSNGQLHGDREGWRHKERMSKPAVQRKTAAAAAAADDGGGDAWSVSLLAVNWSCGPSG